MSLSLTELATRVSRDLAAARRVWLDDQLATAFRAALPPWTTAVSHPESADVAVVLAEEISAEGALAMTGKAKIDAPQVLAVLAQADGETSDAEPIVLRLSQPPAGRATRVFTHLGVIDVIAEGLLIVELAPGVAATELQRLSLPTLLIAPEVTEMVLTPPPPT
ncbi:MAG: hypothetical protein JRI68_35180 [Deltaproteobacteria bacterium]|nr:hypothetical protein [Deltaproteobacteria bacterium]